MPPIEVPILGRSGLIAVIALLHIPFFVNFVMGAPLLAVISEYIGLRKKDARYDTYARHLSYIALVTVAIGAFGGVGLVATNLGLFPRFFAVGANIFFWPLVLELPAFLFEAIFIAAYRYTWDRLADRRGLHMTLGLLGALGAWGSGFIINSLAAFMMTPGRWVETGALLDAVFNPSMLPSYTHRALAAFSITGFFAIVYALVMHARARTDEDRDYAAWAMRWSGAWAVGATALQAVPGVWYMTTLPEAVWAKYLRGELTPLWFGGILIAAVAVLLVYLLAVQRRVVMGGWKRWALVGSVLLILLTTAFMGYSRERARKPYLVYGVMYGNEQMVPAPTAPSTSLTPAPSSGTVDTTQGRPLYEKYNCAVCHQLAGKGGSISLDGIGTKLSADEIAALLKTPPQGMPAFNGSAADLQALAVFLSTQ